jgi:hypothetical protein
MLFLDMLNLSDFTAFIKAQQALMVGVVLSIILSSLSRDNA